MYERLFSLRRILRLGLVSLWALSATACFSQTIHLEAENGRLSGGVAVSTQRSGFSGNGYVTGFTNGSASTVSLATPSVKAGLYDIVIRYRAQSQKGYDMTVDGSALSGMFSRTGDSFGTHDGGDVLLNSGVNSVSIGGGWGYFDIDSIDLVPAKIPQLIIPPAVTADPDATLQARKLMSFLVSKYGKAVLSGQYDPVDNDYLQSNIGKLPAIRGGDFIDYSPTRVAHGADPKNETEKMIAAAKAGQIITMSWHWNVPTDLMDRMDTDANGKQVNHLWWRGFYADSTTFDLTKALSDPNSADYQLLLSNMDVIAAQLKKMSDANVPVLWRPLHEAEGGWFWWGAHGPDSFKQLWRLMFDRFTRVDHLHNLIWVYCSGTNPDWYPGDKYVDIVGVDAYPSDRTDTQTGNWKTLLSEYYGRKLIVLSEYGGVPDIPDMRKIGVDFSYFVSWTGDLGPKKNGLDWDKRVYDWPTVINAGDLPAGLK